MKRLSLLLLMAAAPAWAHQHPVRFDVVCSTADALPGLALLPFVLLAGVGALRALARHRQDR